MIEQGQTYSFRQELYLGIHDLDTDVLKIALYDGNANLTLDTTVYASTNEVTGTGYTAGGNTLTGTSVNLDTTEGIVYVSFNNSTWSSASFTCRGALIYNTSKSNKSVAILNFGSDKTVTSGTFTITFPANTSTSAVIRSV